MMLCFCGICIPVASLLPFLLFLLKPIYIFFKKLFGIPTEVPTIVTTDQNNIKRSDVVSGEGLETNLITISDSTHFADVQRGSHDRMIVKFTASWCKPCKRIEPHYQALSKVYPSITFATVDVDECSDLAAELGVVALPAFQFYRRGKLLGKMSGDNETTLTELLETHANNFGDDNCCNFKANSG